jgi:hypothetical protein
MYSWRNTLLKFIEKPRDNLTPEYMRDWRIELDQTVRKNDRLTGTLYILIWPKAERFWRFGRTATLNFINGFDWNKFDYDNWHSFNIEAQETDDFYQESAKTLNFIGLFYAKNLKYDKVSFFELL